MSQCYLAFIPKYTADRFCNRHLLITKNIKTTRFACPHRPTRPAILHSLPLSTPLLFPTRITYHEACYGVPPIVNKMGNRGNDLKHYLSEI